MLSMDSNSGNSSRSATAADSSSSGSSYKLIPNLSVLLWTLGSPAQFNLLPLQSAGHGHHGGCSTAAQQVQPLLWWAHLTHSWAGSTLHHFWAVLLCCSCRGHDVLVVVTESALGFAKAAAARSSSNTTAEALEYLLVDVHFQEFSKPKPLKLGEVPKPSMFASRSGSKKCHAPQVISASTCLRLLGMA